MTSKEGRSAGFDEHVRFLQLTTAIKTGEGELSVPVFVPVPHPCTPLLTCHIHTQVLTQTCTHTQILTMSSIVVDATFSYV